MDVTEELDVGICVQFGDTGYVFAAVSWSLASRARIGVYDDLKGEAGVRLDRLVDAVPGSILRPDVLSQKLLGIWSEIGINSASRRSVPEKMGKGVEETGQGRLKDGSDATYERQKKIGSGGCCHKDCQKEESLHCRRVCCVLQG